MTVRGVFPGRFQPFHLGHLEIVKWALEKVDELIIVIGTAQESHTIVNPFTAGERMIMIKSALIEEGVDMSRIYIVPVPDVLMNAVWVEYLKLYVPSFKYGISRNPLVIRLFRDAGYEVLIPPAFERDKYSSTKIRLLMMANDPSWRDRVPKAVARVIDEINGVERLREVSRVD